MRKALISILFIGVGIIALNPVQGNSAHAASQALPRYGSNVPVFTYSYYINPMMYSYGNINLNELKSLGKEDATQENTSLQNQGIHCQQGQYLIDAVIDFGSPQSNYVNNWAGGNIYYGSASTQIAGVLLSYANGWYQNSYNCFYLRIIAGVNNNGICGNLNTNQPCDEDSGISLAKSVNEANQQLSSLNEAWQITACGGDDAESGFGYYTPTYDYMYGYNYYLQQNSLGWNLYDFGDASYDSPYYSDWATNGSFSEHVYTLAWGLGYDDPFPEAYTKADSQTWYNVASQNAKGSQGAIQFAPMMVDANCYNNYWWTSPTTEVNGGLVADLEQNFADFQSINNSYIPNGYSVSWQYPLDYNGSNLSPTSDVLCDTQSSLYYNAP
jgi:hypothetical protein